MELVTINFFSEIDYTVENLACAVYLSECPLIEEE